MRRNLERGFGGPRGGGLVCGDRCVGLWSRCRERRWRWCRDGDEVVDPFLIPFSFLSCGVICAVVGFFAEGQRLKSVASKLSLLC